MVRVGLVLVVGMDLVERVWRSWLAAHWMGWLLVRAESTRMAIEGVAARAGRLVVAAAAAVSLMKVRRVV